MAWFSVGNSENAWEGLTVDNFVEIATVSSSSFSKNFLNTISTISNTISTITTTYEVASLSENAIAATILDHVVPRRQTVRTFVAAGVGLIATVFHYFKGEKREKTAGSREDESGMSVM